LETRAVLFDLGNTLVKIWVPEVVYHGILASLGIQKPIEEIKEALLRTEEDFERLGYNGLFGTISYKEYWDKRDALVLNYLGLSPGTKLLEEIQARWFDYAECPLFPDVKSVLWKLKKRGLKIGIISTGYEEDIDAITRKTGLQKGLFDVIVGANTIRRTKPDSEVFKYALKKLKVRPEEALFIGDEIEADYRGAEKAGMQALLIQRTEKKVGQTARAVSCMKTITSLEEIFVHLSK
jgi:putative hydrolase of the HAD superfamily